MIDSATLAPSVKLRDFTRPFAEFTRTRPPVKSNHTGVTCGDPSGMIVAKLANAFFCCSRSRKASGIATIFLPLRRSPYPALGTPHRQSGADGDLGARTQVDVLLPRVATFDKYGAHRES